MDQKDIRWEQRFHNYRKALLRLNEAIQIIKENKHTGEENDMLKESLVKRFEFTHELAWKVMKDYAEYQGRFDIKGPKDATREAFSMNIITDGELWMDMIKSRNLTVHTYDEITVERIFNNIVNSYHAAFLSFNKRMIALKEGGEKTFF